MRVMISAWVGAGNVGDELILSAMLALLRRRDARVLVPSLQPAETERIHRVTSVHHLDIHAADRALQGCDLLIFGGGGLVQDRSSPWSPYYQCLRLRLAAAHDVPVVALGIGAERLRRRGSLHMFASSLAASCGIVARDPSSAAVLRDQLHLNVEVGADLAFTLCPPDRAPEERIVACLRDPGLDDGFVPASMRREPRASRHPETLSLCLRDLADATGLPIRFVAMDRHRDLPLARAVAARLGNAAEDIVVPSVHELLDTIAASRLAVTTRYHGGVAAALAGRPAVLLGYAPKLRALADQLPATTRLLPDMPAGYAQVRDTGVALLRDGVPGTRTDLDSQREAARRNETMLDTVIDGITG